jgi:exosortase A-associated hydrolase 2
LLEPLFIDRASTPQAPRRFAVLHRPASAPRGLVVCAPPFAEEMNKSRRMMALQSRALAGAGFAVLQADLLGCGDSDGDFSDAAWDDWVEDIAASARWLRDHCGSGDLPLWLWGLRTGALLATAAQSRTEGVTGLLFWQPVALGTTALQQFLRLRAAAGLIAGNKEGGADDLRRALLDEGRSVEVAGYRISPELARGLASAKLPALGPGNAIAVEWLEVGASEAPALSPGATATVERWRNAGCKVRASCVQGPSFWQTVEIETAPALITATLRALCTAPPVEPALVG